MYQSIWEFAHQRGLLPKKNKTENIIAAHIVIDENGTYKYIQSYDKKEQIKKLCPDIGTLKRHKNNTSIICEKMEHIICGTTDKNGNSIGNPEKHAGWLRIMREGAEHDEHLRSIATFINNMEETPELMQKVSDDLMNAGVKSANNFISFRIENVGCVEDVSTWEPWFNEWLIEHSKKEIEKIGISCISGKIVPLISQQCFPQVKTLQTGVPICIASFANESPAFRSYGIEDNSGTPMSSEEAEMIKAGMEHLLSSPNNHDDRFEIIYWYTDTPDRDLISMSMSKMSEEDVATIRKYNKHAKQNEAAYTGLLNTFTDREAPKINSRFNAKQYHLMNFQVTSKGRMYVSDEHVDSYENLVKHINEWFEDSCLEWGLFAEDKKFVGYGPRENTNIYGILLTLLNDEGADDKQNADDKRKRVRKEYGRNRYLLLTAMISGGQIPMDIYLRALRKVSNNITGKGGILNLVPLQVIKIYLNRSGKENAKMTERLNTESNNIAYNMGRWLALAEKIQLLASRSPDGKDTLAVTIATANYKALKDNPSRIGKLQDKVIKAYLPKMKRNDMWGLAITLEKELYALSSKIGIPPTRFDLYDKGAFDLGYAQQRTENGKKHDKEEITDTQEDNDNE